MLQYALYFWVWPCFFVQTFQLSRDSYIFAVLLQGHPWVRCRGREGVREGDSATKQLPVMIWEFEIQKKLYWCSVRLLPKLFYSRWSYVAHRFKSAWAIWTVKSWDNTLTHTHTQALTNLPSLRVRMDDSSGCSGGARWSEPPLQSDI